MKEVSIIIPFVGEYPQVLFTIQATAQVFLEAKVDFEIIAVDNYCDEAKNQAYLSARKFFDKLCKYDNIEIENAFEMCKSIYPTHENKSGSAIEACAKGNDWLKYIQYDEKLSHWQSKRIGVEASEGKSFLFIDAHTIPSFGVSRMVKTYNEEFTDKGTFHMPLTYKILEWRKLIYKLVIDNEYFYTYSFTPYKPPIDNIPWFEVPCMSTCGMIISREIYDNIGGWPIGLGIYGGGENFMNYTLAVCGYKKMIFKDATLFHHGEKRDYHWNYDDMLQNRMIAHYLFGGENLLNDFISISKGKLSVLAKMKQNVIGLHYDQRQKIKKKQKWEIQDWEWAKIWKG